MENKELVFKIEHGVPLPRPFSQIVAATLEKMEIGDSFELGQSPSAATIQMVKTEARKRGRIIEVVEMPRELFGSKSIRVWLTGTTEPIATVAEFGDLVRFLNTAYLKDPEGKAQKTVLFKRYLQWCQVNHIEPRTSIRISKDLTELGYSLDYTNKFRLGLRLKPENTFNSNEIIA
jgi:hypothetical protein